jgi:hypothetical protein
MSSSKRHFTAVVGSKEHGLYISASPSSAARKIVSKLCAASKSKKVEFCVREITQGSKKKTYGPYLGEMKKLAKPIKLKGRVIRFETEVHLKKKKTATKTVINLGKKMRGGTITDGGELSHPDFIIKEEELHRNHIVKYGEQNSYPYGQEHPHTRFKYKIVNYDDIQPCRLIRKKDKFKEPFIFVGKKIYGKLVEGSKNEYLNEPIVYREYVAFNEGLFSKTAKFNKLYISDRYSHQSRVYEDHYDLQDVRISDIPKEALEELKKFIEKKRNRANNSFEKNTFCNTIYEAVNSELYIRSTYPRQINIMEEQERQIELIGKNNRYNYRDILNKIRKLQRSLNAPANYHGHDGWTQGYNQNANHKEQFSQELKKLLKKKKEIESKYGIVNN